MSYTPFVWTEPPPTYQTASMANMVNYTSPSSDIPEEKLEPFEEILNALIKRNQPISEEQLAICSHVYNMHKEKENNGAAQNLIIDSVAGSGKTTTLRLCLWFIPPNKRVLFLSFNKNVQLALDAIIKRTAGEIRESLGRSMAKASCYTCHAQGLRALKNHFGPAACFAAVGGNDTDKSDNKYQSVSQAIKTLPHSEKLKGILIKKWKTSLRDMLHLLMNLAVDCSYETQWSDEFILRSSQKYGILMPVYAENPFGAKGKEQNDIYLAYMQALESAYQLCLKRRAAFDFTDMVYLPIRHGYPLEKYDYILVDESQDLNAVQIEMIERSITQGVGGESVDGCEQEEGHIIFVGDKNQAIYGFRGADTHAIDTVARRFRAAHLPLHVCWRCSESVISVAQELVPHIRARPNAPFGRAEMLPAESLLRFLRERDPRQGHMILCRTNAPLITTATKMIQEGLPCQVIAESLRNSLLQLLQQIERSDWLTQKYGKNLFRRTEGFIRWKESNLQSEAVGEQFIEKSDQLDSLYEIMKSLAGNGKTPTAAGVQRRIEQLFSRPTFSADTVNGANGVDDQQARGIIRLCTIHQCKGQEDDVICLIRPELLPHPSAKDSRWQLEQEENLKYVAITRAKFALYYFQ